MPDDFVVFNTTLNAVYRFVRQATDSWYKYFRQGSIWSFVDNVGEDSVFAEYSDKTNEIYQRHKRVSIDEDSHGPLRITVAVPDSSPDVQMAVGLQEIWKQFQRDTSVRERAAAVRWFAEWTEIKNSSGSQDR